MKNKILQYLLILSLHFIVVQKTNALEQFNFDVTNIEILENGKIFKGLNKGIIKTDDGLIIEADEFELIIQVNGKVRGKMFVSKSLKEDEVKNLAMEADNVKNYLNENTIKKVIFIKDKLINFVI